MPLDGYSPCPCGSGKKVKFCCSELLDDLNKIERMIAGDQRLACLDHIAKLEATKPDRPALMAIKIGVLGELHRYDEMREAIRRFVEKHPENPIALAESATLKAAVESPRAGVAQMQQALRACRESIPNQVYTALGTLARMLLSAGQPVAAKAHFSLMMTIAQDDEFPVSMVMQLSSAESLPAMMRDVNRLAPCPDGVAWKDQFAKAYAETQEADWIDAEKSWSELAAGPGKDSPAVWTNLATTRAWTADSAGAAEALRKLAALDIPLDDAVEAEALAQLLDVEGAEPSIDVVLVTYPIVDLERLLISLTADRHTAQAPVEQLPKSDEPPPRARYLLLDRPELQQATELNIADVPKVVGELYVFGKQTDREARLEVEGLRGEDLTRARQVVEQVAGDAIGPAGEEQVIDGESPVSAILSSKHYLPPGTPADIQMKLAVNFARAAVMERWTSYPQKLLGGKTPREAASDPQYRIPLLAAILLLEDVSARHMRGFDFNELREALGLPPSATIDPATVSVRTLPLVRHARLDYGKLSDDELLAAYTHLMLTRYRPALPQATREVVGRVSLDGKIDKAEAYGVLADNAATPDEALEYYGQAAQEAIRMGTSPAQYYLAEVPLRLMRGDAAQFEHLIRVLTTKHAAEPGVREALMRIMYSLGLIGPDGRPTQEMAVAGAPPAAAPAEEGIWTPGAEAQQSSKSGLWLPGMD
ncbi:MAG: hypothetical protein KF708_17570 [Pirellulales bacterium]|nr:hypothetical protein [Pirellulales bacterium]